MTKMDQGGMPPPPERAAKPAKTKESERAERLAAALRANLGRRKAARRGGLDDFAEPGGDKDEA